MWFAFPTLDGRYSKVLRTNRGDEWRQDLSGFTEARVIRESGAS